jgi:hypothetical protein
MRAARPALPRTRQASRSPAAASAPDQWFPGTEGTHFAGQALQGPAAAATQPETAEAAPQPVPGTDAAPAPAAAAANDAESQPDPFPPGTYVTIREGKRKIRAGHVRQRVDGKYWRVQKLGASDGVTVLVSAAQLYRADEPEPVPEAPKSKRRSCRRTTAAPAKPSRSQ